MRKVRILALFALVFVSLGWTSRALATTITIDGNPADWPAGSSIVNDAIDVVGPPDQRVDIREVFFTNSVSTMYWRFDTYGTPTRWTPVDLGEPAPRLTLCMNTDNNTATGVPFAVCNSQTGVDYVVRLQGSDSGAIAITLRNCTSGTCVNQAGALAVASSGPVTEFSIALSDLGITGPCTSGSGCIIPSAIYFDNQDLPSDDNVPDNGIFQVELPGPTAITLSSLNASGAAAPLSSQSLAWAGFALVAVGGLGGMLLRRRRSGRI